MRSRSTNRRPPGQPIANAREACAAAADGQGAPDQTSVQRTGIVPIRGAVRIETGKHGGDWTNLRPFLQSGSIHTQTRCHLRVRLWAWETFSYGCGRSTSGRGLVLDLCGVRLSKTDETGGRKQLFRRYRVAYTSRDHVFDVCTSSKFL